MWKPGASIVKRPADPPEPGPPMLARQWSAEAFHAQATRHVRQALDEGRPIALLGAGQTGARVAGLLGDAVVGFLDDTPAKAGTQLLGKPVRPVDDGLAALPAGALVVVCIFSTLHRFAQTRQRLAVRADIGVCPFTEVLLQHPASLPNLYLGPIAHQVAQRERYARLERRLADAPSRRVLDDHLRMRLIGEFDALPDRRDDDNLLGITADECPAFVDGGAFDGDTLRDFLAWRGERFARVVAFEPDDRNFERLLACHAALPPHQRERVELRRQALWSCRTELAFDATGAVGSALNGSGQARVQTECLEALDALPDPLFVKLDVEGAEAEVIGGAAAWIRRRRPLLAISAYHRPDDLLELFEQVDALGVAYRYHLRCHGGDGTDLMLYCVASGAASTRSATTAAATAATVCAST